MNEQVQRIMRLLDCDEQNALDVIESDKRIDRGEKLFELTDEQKRTEKQMRATGTKAPTVYRFDKRERKTDNDKRDVITMLADAITQADYGEPAQIINPEREIVFDYHGRKLKIVLSAPRS